MLKITIQKHQSNTTLVLEGKLAGAWVPEVQNCWQGERASAQQLCVDLNGVTFIDADGKALLGRLYREGTTLEANGCLTRAIVAEVSGKPSDDSTRCVISKFLKRRVKILLVGFLLLSFGANHAVQAQDKPAIQLTLHDAVALALKQNPQVQIGKIQASEAKQDQNIARAGFLPQVQLDTSVAAVRANLEAEFGSRFAGLPEHIGPFEIFNAGTQVSVPILDFSQWSRWQAAKQNTAASLADQQAIRERMVLQTVSQYLTALRAAAEVRSAESRASLAKALFDQATDLQKNGAGTGIDTLRANVELQNENQRLMDAQTQHQVALYGLVWLLNLDPHQPVELSDEMSFFETPEFALESSVERAYQARPELQQADANLRAADANKRAAGEERLPTITATGSWNYQGLSINTGIPVYNYQAGMNLPLFTGGRIRAETTRADLEIKRVQQQRDDLRNQIALEVKTALAQLQSARHQVDVANLGVQLSQEEVTQARDRFAAGVADNIEVVQAQDALARANDNQIAALFQYNEARADLAHAIGQTESLYTK
jgi:outer membrane protein TolC/ABC-type transporter Mla MlaB component